MILRTDQLKFELDDYKYPLNKIKSMCDKGEIIPLKKGLYLMNPDWPGYMCANTICFPSYLSFQYALYWWNLIPEAVYVYTSASFGKNKNKTFETPKGVFTYTCVPERVYPLGIRFLKSQWGGFMIASPEKALCDLLYTLKPVSSLREMEGLLFESLRIDDNEFAKLSLPDIEEIARSYHCTNVTYLEKMMKRRKPWKHLNS